MSFFKNPILKIRTWYFQRQEKNRRHKIQRFHRHDEKLVQRLAPRQKLPTWKQFCHLSEFLTRPEKLILRVISGLIIIAIFSLLIQVYWTHSQLVPKAGGSYTEGLVGAPRYINPLFAQANDVDLDLAALIFSGLLKYTDDGPAKDLAADYQISSDQKIYTFHLRQDVVWQDGEKFNAEDVLFTFNRIKNPQTKTPLYYNFNGATIEKLDNFTVRFTLEEPFAPFLESLTVGILPNHLWQNTTPENTLLAEYNLKPVGTGPYQFKSLLKNKDGAIKSFHLVRNAHYYQAAPFIDEMNFKFYPSFENVVEALNNKNVDGISYLPKEIRGRIINNRNLNFHLLNLPQYTAVFFNYDQSPILKDVAMRKILSHAVNKEKIVNEILNAEAQIIQGCVLPGTLGYTSDFVIFPYNVEHAREELDKAGWVLADYKVEKIEMKDGKEVKFTEEYPYSVRKKQNRYLEFTLTTVNQPETVKIAKELQQEWQQINVKMNLDIVDPDKMPGIIKSRSYEALLYGQILGYDPDPYPFWHSSQRTYPGLNLTSLNSPEIDVLLATSRKTSDETERAKKYEEFQKKLAELVPAVFLFNPTYTYPQSKEIKGFNTKKIINPANRFNQINEWYIKTDRRWGKTSIKN